MFSRKDNTEKLITTPASESELSPEQEKEVIEKCEELIEEFDERHKDEDDSIDILQKP